MPRRVALLFVVLLLAGFSGSWRAPPWHLADVWWHLAEEEEFQELAIDVTITGDPASGSPFFIAPIGLMTLNGVRFYAGLQTRMDFGQGMNEPGVIFSRWDERSVDHIRKAPGGIGVSSGHEGDFISVRNRMSWGAGEYETILNRLEGENDGQSWINYRVCVRRTDRCVDAGSLRFPDGPLRLKPTFASFVEVYGPGLSPEKIPGTKVTLGNIRINGKPVRFSRATAYYPGDVPPLTRAASDGGNGVVFDIGQPFDQRPLPATKAGARYHSLTP